MPSIFGGDQHDPEYAPPRGAGSGGFIADPTVTLPYEKPATLREDSIQELAGQGIRTINSLIGACKRPDYEHSAMVDMLVLFEKIITRNASQEQRVQDLREMASRRLAEVRQLRDQLLSSHEMGR